MKFYRCLACGSIVAKINSVGESPWCCGKPMMEIKPGVTEAATEKHIPVITRNGNEVTATVGSILHPMDPDHYIEWIELLADGASHIAFLNPGDAPEAEFCVKADKVTAREFCNKHGLWKAEFQG